MNKRISFFGCSFTAGSELHDHIILKMSFEECNKLKKKYHPLAFEDMVNRQLTLGKNPKTMTELGTYPTVTEYNRTVGYPSMIAKLLNVDYQNHALPGSSVEQNYISLRILDNNKTIEPHRDILFVGLTTLERILSLKDNGIICSDVLGYADLPMEVVEHYNSHRLVWNYFNAINSMIEFAENRGYQLILQPMYRVDILNPAEDNFKKTFNTIDFNTWPLTSFIKYVWERSVKLMPMPEKTLFLVEYENKFEPCGYGHYSVQSHQVFSELLAPRMKEILCLKD